MWVHHCIGSDSPSPLVPKLGHKLLPDLHFPWTSTLPIGLACWEARTTSGQAEIHGTRFSQPSVWELTLSAPWSWVKWLLLPLKSFRNCALHYIPNLTPVHKFPNISSVLLVFPPLNSDIHYLQFWYFKFPFSSREIFCIYHSKQWSFKWMAQNPSTPVVLAMCAHKEGYDSELPIFISWLVTLGKRAFQYHWLKLYKYLSKLQVFPLQSSGFQSIFFFFGGHWHI